MNNVLDKGSNRRVQKITQRGVKLDPYYIISININRGDEMDTWYTKKIQKLFGIPGGKRPLRRRRHIW